MKERTMFVRPIDEVYQDKVQQIEMSLKEAPDEEILDESQWPGLLKRACEPYHFRDFVTLGQFEPEEPVEVDGRHMITVKVPFQGNPMYFSLQGGEWDPSLGFEVGNGFVAKAYPADTPNLRKKVEFDVTNLKKYLHSTQQRAEGCNRNFEGLLQHKLVRIQGDLKRQRESLQRAKAAKDSLK